jgi:threonine synthase
MSATATRLATRLVCAGCGTSLAAGEPYPFRCPNAGRDDADHVLRRELDMGAAQWPAGDEQNPFVRFRALLHAYHEGLTDAEFCALVRELDDRVADVEGHGFVTTPLARANELSDVLGFSAEGGVWIKDETGNVSGSHKARHLFGVLIWLEVAERIGLIDRERRRDLAIASCGNAAVAAAVVAAAGRRTLHVYVPTLADPAVLECLERLGAEVTFCPRQRGVLGDPTLHRLHDALAEGALPFTCQGDLNGLAVEGGHTLAWELAASGITFDRLVVQVGGGALASACIHGLQEAVALGALAAMPRIDTVQTEGAWPLKRAYEAVVACGDLAYAAHHRSEFMWPWESEPRSIAHGILDDETYDWLAVVEGMLATGGAPLVVDEERLGIAYALALETTDIPVDPTGSAGLAGLLALRAAREIGHDDRIAVLFTGLDRSKEVRR